MKIILKTFIFLFITSCALVTDTKMKPRTLENYYVSTGVEKYFLTDIPNWANFDQKAACFRSFSIRYFDLSILMKSYSISYNKALQMQAAFNEEYGILQSAIGNRPTTLKEEELLFYKISEKVSNKIIFFDTPTFKKINLVWLDEIIGDAKAEKKLRGLLNSKVMEEAVPVLVSLCLSRAEIEKKYPDISEKIIPAEMMSTFNKEGGRQTSFQVYLREFFSADQKLIFFSQKNIDLTDVIIGIDKTQNY